MRKLFLRALCTALSLTLALGVARAQEQTVDTKKWITLTVKQGDYISLAFAASAGDVGVKVSGVEDEKIEKAPMQLQAQRRYKATGTEIKVFGAIEQFSCHSNTTVLTAIDVSANPQLTLLNCFYNQLTTLDVSENVNLTYLNCSLNRLSALNVSKNVKLTNLSCAANQLSTLDVSENVELTELNCAANQLLTLDVSRNVKLTKLSCAVNQLSTLDMSKNSQLNSLSVYDNNFSTSTLNMLYCSLPSRPGQEKGVLFLTKNEKDPFTQLVKSTSKATTDAKNWVIRSFDDVKEIKDITGSFTCGSPYALTLSPAYKEGKFPCEGGEWQVKVASTGAWKLDKTQLPNWLRVEPESGENGTVVKVTVSPNNDKTKDRAFPLAFMLTDGSNTKQVVTVGQLRASLSVMPIEDYTLPAAGETKENYFTVKSTGKWKVTSSNAEWNVLDKSEGVAGETKVTLKAEMNPSTAERSTKLTFSLVGAEEVKQEITVKQAGSSITVAPAEDITLPAAGETKENYFTVTSTSAWKVTGSNAEWNVLDEAEGAAGETKVTLKTEMNPSTAERSTKLTFALVGAEEVKQEVTVKQAGASITVTPAEDVTLPAAGDTKAEYFTVTSTRAWYVTSSNAAWNVLDRTEGTGGDTKVTLKAEMNPSTAERSTKLSFTLVGAEGLKQEVTIKQAGSSITVTPAEDVTLPAAGETKAEYFTVKSTGVWKVTSSNAAWNVLDKTEGEKGETKLTLQTGVNPSTTERSTVLTFVLEGAEEVKQEVTVKQAGKSTTPNPSKPSDPSKPSTPLAVESTPLASIVVAPNPFTTQLQIINDAWVEGEYELLTASGVVVRSGALQGRETVLNTVELRSGGYLLRLLVGKEQKTIFVVKE